jgi:protein TonB
MKPFIACFLVLLAAQVHSQARKKVSLQSENPACKELYSVLKDNTEIKDGPYKKDYEFFVIEGEYANGHKSGIWKYFFEKELISTVDQATGQIQFVNPPKTNPISMYWIKEGENWVQVQPDVAPRFLGDAKAMYTFIGRIMRYPAMARRMQVQGKVNIKVTITTQGEMIDHQFIDGIGSGCDEEALRALKLIPNEWAPGKINGETRDIQMVFTIIFKLA